MKIEAHYNPIVTDDGIELGGAFVPRDMAVLIHQKVADIGWCGDDICPCHEAGYQQGVEDAGSRSKEH